MAVISTFTALADTRSAHVGAGAILCCISLTVLIYYVYITYLHPLSRVLGPFWARFSRLWMAYNSRRGDMHITIRTLHQKYGRLVRIAPNEVSVADLDAIRTIYGPGSKFQKSNWYSVWQGTQKTDLFAERDIRTHSDLKRKISRIYAMSSLTPLEKWIDNAVECFMDQMRRQGTSSIDLGVWLQLLAFDVIGEVSFSRRFGFLEAGRDDGTLAKIELALKSLASVGQIPWLFWVDHYVKPVLGSHLNLSLRHGLIRKYASQEVEARRTRPTEHDDILGALFRVQQEKGETKLGDEAITSIATANVFAGSDTTAISLRAICYFLLTNPACLTVLRQETAQRKADGRLSWPATFKQVSDWPYLQAIISEALRLHPAVGLTLPRVTTVGVNAWVVHHNPAVYGEDHETFGPERWLGGNKGDMERYFFAFGGGQRLCIGKNISMIEMSKLIPYFFDEFEVSLADAGKKLEEDCHELGSSDSAPRIHSEVDETAKDLLRMIMYM